MFRTFLSIRNIRELIEIVLESNRDELEVHSWGRIIRIVKGTTNSSPVKAGEDVKEIKLIEIKSSMVGTFHLAPSPDSESDELHLLKVGQRIKKDQLIYVIEAMHLTNEFKSDTNGTIVEILVKDKAPVQFGQPLLLIDPQ